jgi:signal transduction histidine kinase
VSSLSRLSLQQRLAAYAALLGIALSLAFAAALWRMIEDYEVLLMEVLLAAEVEGARAELAAERAPRMPHGRHLRGWHLAPGSAWPAELPAELAALADGVYEEMSALPPGVHASLVTVGGHRLIYLMDLNQVESRERYLLFASFLVVLVGATASALGARWLAGRALDPLTRLAEAIDNLPPPPAVRMLAPSLHDPLLRRIGQALDGYQRRLAAAEHAREAFFADASHELRSPIASLRGAAEVLLDDADTPTRLRRRLERIERAVEELSQLLDGLLLSARALPERAPGCTLGEPLQRARDRLATRARARGVQLATPIGMPGPALTLPAAWVEVLLVNLLRSVIDHPGTRAIALAISGPQLVIGVEGCELAESPTRSDSGLGLRLARSLGERLGVVWQQGPAGLWLDFSTAIAAPV